MFIHRSCFPLLFLCLSSNIVSIVCSSSTSTTSTSTSADTNDSSFSSSSFSSSSSSLSSLFDPSLPTPVANGDHNLLEFTSHHIRGNSLLNDIHPKNPPPPPPYPPCPSSLAAASMVPLSFVPSASPTRTTMVSSSSPTTHTNYPPPPPSSSSYPLYSSSSSFYRFNAPYLNIGITYAALGDTFLCPLNRTLDPPPSTVYLGSEFKVGAIPGGAPLLPIAYVNLSLALFNADPSTVVVDIYNSDINTHLPTTLVTGGTSIQTSVVATQPSGTDNSVIITELITEFFPWVNLTLNSYYYLVYSLTTAPSSGNTPFGCIVSNLAPEIDPFILYQYNSEIVTRTTSTGSWTKDLTKCNGLAGCTTWYSLYGPGPTPSTSPSLSATSSATASSIPTRTAASSPTATRSSIPTLTMSLSSTRSAMSTATATLSSLPSLSATLSSLATYSATQSATQSATSTSSLNVTNVETNNAPPDTTPLIIGASVGSILGFIVIGGGIFVCVRLAWEGKGPWKNRPIPHGPKQFKDRSVSARFDRRLKQYQNPAAVPAGTYASKHPQAVPQGDSLRMMADAYAAIYATQGNTGNEDIDYSNKSTLPLDNLPHADLVAAAANNNAVEWGSNRNLHGGGSSRSSKLNQKARFTPLAASSRTITSTTTTTTTTTSTLNPVNTIVTKGHP